MAAETDVAIVGMGAVFPGAGDVATFWRNLCDGVDSITDVPPSRWDPDVYYDPTAVNGHSASDRFYCRRGGFVDDLADFDPATFGVMPSAVAGTEPDQLMALRTAAEAVADAGGIDRLPDPTRIGVIIGRGGYLTPASARMDQRVRTSHQMISLLSELVPGITTAQLDAVRTAFDDQLGPASPESSIGMVPNFAASRVANRFDFRGPAYTVDAACASSLVAIDHAVRELASGRCDAVLAGAVHHCHVATLWSVFTQLKALSPSQAIRPFDRRADGTLMSEGTGIVVLKRLADAERAGDRVYAVIRGTGVASDGRASSLMSPLVDGQVLAVDQAWREAGLDPTAAGALGLLEAHGTATPTGDQVELETVARAFGPGVPGAERIGLGTVKSNIGHAMPAAGIAGLIKAALAVHHGVRPPTLHVEEPHPAIGRTRFRPVTELEPWDRPTAATPRRAAVNAFGFGGINAHVVLEEAPGWRSSSTGPPPPRTGDTATAHDRITRHQLGSGQPGERVLLLTATTVGELAGRLAASSDDELLAAATTSVTVAPGAGGPVRLAIVEPTVRTLALARKVVARGTPWRGRSDVWFTADPLLAGPGKIAFLFPGLEPEFEPRVDDVADHLRLARPRLSGGEELVERSLDVIVVGRFLADALSHLGVTPDVMAGHSLGEWTAMIASGLYERTAIDEFVGTLRPGMLEVPDLVYAALGCGVDRAATAIAGLPDVAVSHDNCPHQSVICGTSRSIAIAVERLRADQVMAQPMPFRSGFHSPMLAPYLGAVRASFDRLPIHRASVPVWSATTVAPFPEEAGAVRDLILRHLLEPVRFGPLTRRLHAEGVRAFLQVGPGSLSGFVDDTLKDEPYLAMPANVASRSGLAQLRRVAAALWTEGRDVRWDRLATPGPPVPSPTTVRLDLGTPLVRLNGSAPRIVAAGFDGALIGAPALELTGNPVLAELGAALQDATESARRIVSAWQSAPAPAAAATAAPAPAAPRRSSVEKVFSLDTLPYVRDHCLLLQPEDWADDSDRFPVVALTTLLELMADAARALVPGRTVVGFSQVRALRWLIVAPPVTVTITAAEDGPDRVKVAIEGYSSGVVLLADAWPTPPAGIHEPPLTGERTPSVSAAQLYDDRWMFHGPRFAGVSEVTAFADDGIRGVLQPLPSPGALLDSAGQLIGHWMQVGVDADRTVFPVSVDDIRLYGPQPAASQPVDCTARVTELTDTGMRADATLRTPDGAVWCHIGGWATRRFATDDVIWRVKFAPEVAGVGEPQPGGWCLVRERWPGTASRELMMRRYLNAAERAEYEGLNARRQRHWLLGRVAAKDAVRTWLWQHGHGPVFPCEITVSNDHTGQPRVVGPFPGELHVSIAHSGELGVALVSPDGPVGIDVEAVDDRALDTERIGFTDAEHHLLDTETAAAGVRTTALVRFWAAKEAVAKARGTGFLGNPRNFEVTGKTGDLLDIVTGGDRYRTTTQLIDGPTASYAVAWTTTATEGAE